MVFGILEKIILAVSLTVFAVFAVQAYQTGTVPTTYKNSHCDVVLYTTASCPYCAKARKFLQKERVAWCEKDINKSERYHREFKSLGGRGVPLALYGGRKRGGKIEGVRIIKGYSKEAYSSAFSSM